MMNIITSVNFFIWKSIIFHSNGHTKEHRLSGTLGTQTIQLMKNPDNGQHKNGYGNENGGKKLYA